MTTADMDRILRRERVSWYVTWIWGAVIAGYVIAAIWRKA